MESEYSIKSINELLEKLDKGDYVNAKENIEFSIQVYSRCKESNYEIGMAFALLKIGIA